MKNPFIHFRRFAFAAVSILALNACTQEECEDCGSLTIPAGYTFSNVNYSGQTERLSMLTEMMNYVKSANTPNTTLDAQKLTNMFANQNNPFSKPYTRQLKDKCVDVYRDSIESYLKAVALASQSQQEGRKGVAGVVKSLDGSKSYLFDANGIEYAQRIEKGIMGGVFYYQATAVYLSESKMNVDNTTVKEGEGTTMEHHWDEAFGYFGATKEFPKVTDSLLFYAKYCNARNALMQTNDKIMKDGFLKGRAAISAKKLADRDAAITQVRSEWERIIAATALSYLRSAQGTMNDLALRNHALSEATTFIYSLKFNPSRKITDAQLKTILDAIGYNFYDVTTEKLEKARTELSKVYGMDSLKDTL